MKNLFVGIFCFLASEISYAGTISLVSVSSSVQLGATADVQLWMDFSADPTLGGGIDITYDPGLLSFNGFSFDSAFLTHTDPTMTCPGAMGCPTLNSVPGTVFDIAFGNFVGLSGPSLVGTLSFTAVGTGTATISTTGTSGTAGPFVSATTYMPQTMNYTGTSIVVSSVPILPSVWLMISGLLLFPYRNRLITRRSK